MKIIILGTGRIGKIVAQAFANDLNDLVIIDQSEENLQHLNESLDILTMYNDEISISVLEKAGAADADMIVAAAKDDKINMLACIYAKHIFKIAHIIVRIRSQESYKSHDLLFNNNVIPASQILYPEQILSDQIIDLIKFNGVSSIAKLADEKFACYQITANYGGNFIGQELKKVQLECARLGVYIASIRRNEQYLNISGETTIEALDKLLVICPFDQVLPSTRFFIRPLNKPRRIMISGSGVLCMVLGSRLEESKDYSVKIFEPDKERAKRLSDVLQETVIINSSINNHKEAYDEGIEECDLFISINNNNEDNIVNSLLAKKLGAKKVITLLDNLNYSNLLNISDIDTPISIAAAITTLVKSHSKFSSIKKIVSLDTDKEIYEFSIEGDSNNNRLIGIRIKDLVELLPKHTIYAGLIRDSKLHGYDDNFVILAQDHLLIYIYDKRSLISLIKLFSVSEEFF